MARSYKSVFGPTWNARTHKDWKRMSNRVMRRYAKRMDLLTDEDYVFPTLKECGNIWSSPRDGKWFGYPELSLQELKNTWWAKRWWRFYYK